MYAFLKDIALRAMKAPPEPPDPPAGSHGAVDVFHRNRDLPDPIETEPFVGFRHRSTPGLCPGHSALFAATLRAASGPLPSAPDVDRMRSGSTAK